MVDGIAVTNWYVVRSKDRSESRVVRELARKAVATFLPLTEITRRFRGRRRSNLEPLFPGYLFVRLESIAGNPGVWDAVRWTPGVRAILGGDGIPDPVPDHVVEAIQERVRDLGFVRPKLDFASRDRVIIRHGPFAGLEAVFDRGLSPSGRVQVLMKLLGRESRVQIDALDLELA